MNRQTTIFDDSVATRIQALLDRCDRIRRGTEIDRPIRFDLEGERHANSVALRDRQRCLTEEVRGRGGG